MMLKRLSVKNFALISSLELEFGENLNILSGETGAGKSIIVDCIMLLRGGRYDKTMLRYGESNGFIEGVFTLDERLKSIFADYISEDDDELVVFRKFTQDGKNEIRINGRSATLSMLKVLMLSVVDICGQNEHQILADVSNHIKIVDFYAANATKKILQQLSEKYRLYRDIKQKMENIGDARSRALNVDVYKYQLREIDDAKLKMGEEEELIQKRKRLLSSEKICAAFSNVAALLGDNGENASANELLNEAAGEISRTAPYDDRYSDWYDRLKSAIIEISDIADAVADEVSSFDFSQEELDAVEKRLDVIRSVTSKYGKYDEIIVFREELLRKIDEIENADEYYDSLLKQKTELINELYAASVDLSLERKKAAKQLETSVMAELNELGMERSVFEAKFAPLPELCNCENRLSANGMDEVEFYLCPNEGQPMYPLVKIISGGELSRLMLALKVVSSGVDDTPIVIFDEIDTGISGRVGREIAKKLARLSVCKQLLCVTHLPQIAAMADNHFYIEKRSVDGKTSTFVTPLNECEQVDEIARLSGGKDISSGANDNAAQMKEWSSRYKASL